VDHLRRVTFRPLVLLNHVRFQLVEKQLVEEHVVWNVRRSSQPAAVLVIEEDRLEAWSMSIEEELVLGSVEELRAFAAVAEQRVWMALEYHQSCLEVLTADVDAKTTTLFHLGGR